MDPITSKIVEVLCKCAVDKGTELAKQVGPKALALAKDMSSRVLGRLRGKPLGETIAAQFEEDPETYHKPLEKELDKEITSDPNLVEQLRTLLAQFEQAAKEHTAATGTTYQATLTGNGAIAQGAGAVAAGKGGVATGGDVKGSFIVTGDGNITGQKPKDEG